MKADPERDFVRLGENFYIGFLYGDVTDESEFLRSFRAIWLGLKSDNVEEMSRKIVESGLVRKLRTAFEGKGDPFSRLFFNFVLVARIQD
jgi:hypothetical protein